MNCGLSSGEYQEWGTRIHTCCYHHLSLTLSTLLQVSVVLNSIWHIFGFFLCSDIYCSQAGFPIDCKAQTTPHKWTHRPCLLPPFLHTFSHAKVSIVSRMLGRIGSQWTAQSWMRWIVGKGVRHTKNGYWKNHAHHVFMLNYLDSIYFFLTQIMVCGMRSTLLTLSSEKPVWLRFCSM
jgi:hypothetical protein